MTQKEYKQLKEKYRKWKQFLVTEFDNYELAKLEVERTRSVAKQAMIDSYDAVKGVVLELEGYGLGLATKARN